MPLVRVRGSAFRARAIAAEMIKESVQGRHNVDEVGFNGEALKGRTARSRRADGATRRAQRAKSMEREHPRLENGGASSTLHRDSLLMRSLDGKIGRRLYLVIPYRYLLSTYREDGLVVGYRTPPRG